MPDGALSKLPPPQRQRKKPSRSFGAWSRAGETLLLSEAKAARRLGVSSYTMQRFRKRGEIGFCQIGSAIRYTEKQISEFIEKASKASCQENDFNSATIGFPSVPVQQIGMQPTSTSVPDKQSVHHLAQAIFSKPN